MGDLGFWLCIIFVVAISNLEKIGNAFKDECKAPVVQEEVVDGE
jgi:hypothetical protein